MLLIGGSGVGKSTWINAFANYCSFETLNKAEKAGGKFPISSTFEICHPQTGNLVSISSECSELTPVAQATEVGESVTQIPDEYIFQYQNTKIVIIDTPGLLDTRDVGKDTHDTDKEHVNNILRLLSAYNQIHAICILLKANENRLSAAFQYVITEILKHLDIRASNNVIFVFTYAASMSFKPDKAQSILQKFLTVNNLQIDLPPSKATVYCFESDSVQYLVERKYNIPADRNNKEQATKNWRKSKDSTAEMIRYVCSLDPLPLDGINTIYNAQCTIGILSKLVLETVQCVADNIKKLESKKEEAEQMKAKLRMSPTKFQEFSNRTIMFVEKRRIVRTALGYTNVVCEAPKCVSFLDGEPAYTQICCKYCKSPFMYICNSMNLWANCKRCGCGKSKHEWAMTETKVVTDSVPLVQEKVGRAAEIGHAAQNVESDSAMENINKAISECKNRVQTYKRETEHMLRTCAKLNTYVNQNILLISSDVDEMTRNLQNRLATYESPKAGERLSDLKQIQSQYEEYLVEEKSNRYTSSHVHELIQELYALSTNGCDLKQAMEVEQLARRNVTEVREKANPVMDLADFCGQFISKDKPESSCLCRRFQKRHAESSVCVLI